MPKSRSRSSSPYRCAWSRISPTSTVLPCPGSSTIPSKADSNRSASRPRRTMRYLPPVMGSAPVATCLVSGAYRGWRCPGGTLLCLGDCPGGVDQPDVAERLREVADHLAAAGVDLLGEQADVVDRRHRPLECRRGLVYLTGQRLGLGEPEGAQQEGALLPRQAVVGQVPVHQAALVGEAGGR